MLLLLRVAAGLGVVVSTHVRENGEVIYVAVGDPRFRLEAIRYGSGGSATVPNVILESLSRVEAKWPAG